MRWIRPNVCLAWTLAAGFVAAGAHAQQQPGVGYSALNRGLSISRYILDSVLNRYTLYPIDFLARPDLAGQSPNSEYFNFSDPAVRSAYEQRYGAATTTARFIRWEGPGNETRFILRDALAWAHAAHPEWLVNPGLYNGEPTELEITDAQAVNDRALYNTYLIETAPGFSPERRVHICDTNRPGGEIDTIEPFWNLPYYLYNDHVFYPVSPQPPGGC